MSYGGWVAVRQARWCEQRRADQKTAAGKPVALIKTVSINMAFAVDFIFKLRPNIVATEQKLQSRQK